MCPYAIQQSKTQIADWLADAQLMLDTSVVLTVEVALQMAFCMLAVHVLTTGPVKKRTLGLPCFTLVSGYFDISCLV